MPAASPPSNAQPRRSPSSTSTPHSNPTTPSVVRPTIPQQPHHNLTQPTAHQPTRTMSIGSLVDQSSIGADYVSHPHLTNFNDFPYLPVPAAPPLLYGLSPSESPKYPSSTSDSCYSPMSDLIQPQIATQPQYLPPDDLSRAHSASLDGGFPQTVYANPMDPAGWGYDQAPLSAPMHGMGMSMVSLFNLFSVQSTNVRGNRQDTSNIPPLRS